MSMILSIFPLPINYTRIFKNTQPVTSGAVSTAIGSAVTENQTAYISTYDSSISPIHLQHGQYGGGTYSEAFTIPVDGWYRFLITIENPTVALYNPGDKHEVSLSIFQNSNKFLLDEYNALSSACFCHLLPLKAGTYYFNHAVVESSTSYLRAGYLQVHKWNVVRGE